MKKGQPRISEEARRQLLDASFALRFSFKALEKSCSVAQKAFKQAGPAMKAALKKCKPD